MQRLSYMKLYKSIFTDIMYLNSSREVLNMLESLIEYLPSTAAEIFGVTALTLHLIGYAMYGWMIFHEWGRPHILTWFMWLAGGIVEYATYQAIPGAHWSSNALPFACVLGLGFITLAIIFAQVKNWFRGTEYMYEPPETKDYWLFGFDAGAGLFWWIDKWSAAFANFIAVGTSVFTFIPLWRATWRNPDSEHYLPWTVWTAAYMAMFLAVMTGPGAREWELYVYPLTYFVFHAIVVLLCLRVSSHNETTVI